MTTLHIIRQSASLTSDLVQCLSVIQSKDALILMDDGCYNTHHELLHPLISNSSITINCIEDHARARAVPSHKGINLIQMSEVVELTFIHDQVITWQ